METILEVQRRYHEERERLVNELTKEMLYQPSNRYFTVTHSLKELYDDKDGLRKLDIQSLSGPNEFNEFYNRLKKIKEFHRKNPNEIFVPMSSEFEQFKQLRESSDEANAVLLDFSDEEGYGRYLDLHEPYKKYLNLKGCPRIDYLTYISFFDRLSDISRDRKGMAYKTYLDELIAYLENFLSRARPLIDLGEETKDTLSKFAEQWADGSFPGWSTGKETASALTHSGAYLDLTSFNAPEELASLGLDRLKSALMALNLKCGGTLEERAKRLWSVKGKAVDDLPAELFATNKRTSRGYNKTTVYNAPALLPVVLTSKQREIAQLEARVYRLAELIGDIREATIDHVQRRQARIGSERDLEDDDGGDESTAGGVNKNDEDEADDDDIPYNPKNLPLGWDGKPIPYWLYKLHGLNMYYSCEICGNQTYRGPKAFQQHFSEWRHAHGMRCLGIPNTIHFAHITKIEDALALWQRLRTMKEGERWRPELEEELEDSDGNVLIRKTYEDMKRQGLL